MHYCHHSYSTFPVMCCRYWLLRHLVDQMICPVEWLWMTLCRIRHGSLRNYSKYLAVSFCIGVGVIVSNCRAVRATRIVFYFIRSLIIMNMAFQDKVYSVLIEPSMKSISNVAVFRSSVGTRWTATGIRRRIHSFVKIYNYPFYVRISRCGL
jgi:hypothetical protein